MKLSTLLVAGSLAANAVLLAVYVGRTRSNPATPSGDFASTDASVKGAGAAGKKGTAGANPAGTDQAEGKTWAALNTADMRALAERLRAAGFPAAVVRSVIWTQVNESFKARRAAIMPAAEDKPFWKTDSSNYGGGYDPKYYAAMRDLGREQAKIVKDALGTDVSPDSEISDYQRRRFGDLPRDKIDQLQRLDQDYNDLRNEVNSSTRGIMLPEDRQKLAMLEQEKRADLAQVLSPQEMDDYLMRTSPTTNRLRNALTVLNASEAEFRAIYQAQSAFDDKYSYQNIGNAYSPDLQKERQTAQADVNNQIKAALGDQRYADYVRASDREFQQLNRIAQQNSLADTVAVQVYDLRNSTLKESNRIFDDVSLAPDQKRTALQALGQTARAQITSTLGNDVAPRYLEVANRWLAGLDRGAAVSFNESGGMSTRNVPVRRPNPVPPAGTPPAPAPTP